MAFKMKGSPIIAGTQKHSSALTAKKQLDSSLKAMGASPMDGNAFGLAMQKAGGDYKKAKQMLESDAMANMNTMANMNSPADAMDSPANKGKLVKYGIDLFNKGKNVLSKTSKGTKSSTRGGKNLDDIIDIDFKDITNKGKSFVDKGKKLLKKAAIGTGLFGAGYFSKGESDDLDKNVKNQINKNKNTPKNKKGAPGDPYGRAKKNDPNLDNYIRERKKYPKGSPEYNKLQNKINEAYGVSKRHPVGGASNTTKTVTSAKPSKADIKKTKIQSKADKRKGEIDENVARKSTRKTYRTARKTGTAQEAADAKVKMLEAKLADVTGAGGGRKRVLFGKLTAKNIQKKLDKARAKAGSPANKNEVTAKAKAAAGVGKKGGANIGRTIINKAKKAKMKAAGVGRKN